MRVYSKNSLSILRVDIRRREDQRIADGTNPLPSQKTTSAVKLGSFSILAFKHIKKS
jgi:hypothetical protein